MIDHMLVCVPPTPNGGLHLGHLSGPYLGCDILARALRQKGKTVLTVSGIDDHQGYVHTKARADGVTCEQTVQKYGASIRDTWRKAKFDFDLTPSPNGDVAYASFVQDFFSKMQTTGAIQCKAGKAVYSNDEKMHLFQGYLRGICPHCDRTCDGNMCEDCSLPNSGWDIKGLELSYPETGKSIIEEDVHFVNPTAEWDTRLGDFAKNVIMSQDRRSYLENLAQTSPGQADAAIAHCFPWGLSVPESANRRDAVIDVWFEMAAAFLYYPEYAGIDWKDVWSKDTKTSIFFGVDNSFYVAAMFPYLYSHLSDVKAPDYLFSNHFLYLEGQKFSTSRNHAIWGADFFESEPVDIARFYLACNRPENAIENFEMHGYETFKAEKVAQFQKLKAAVSSMGLSTLLKDKQVVLPNKFMQDLRDIDTLLSPDNFSAKNAARRLEELLTQWTAESEGCDNLTRLHCAARLVHALAPIAPELYEELDNLDAKAEHFV